MSSLLRQWLIFFFCVFISDTVSSSKYTQAANTFSQDGSDLDFDKQTNPFRMQKVNLLWAKAKKRLSSIKLADLYADLKVHDKHEVHLKKLRADEMDKDGAMEAKVLTSYRRIVEHYGLDDILSPDDGYKNNEVPHDDDDKKSVHFQDPKLHTMWKRAEEAGFSDSDLEMLKQEFWHQQMKINEFNFVHREMDALADPDDNSIDAENRKLNLSPAEAKERKGAMKKDSRDIKEGYLKLEHLASSLPSSEPTFKDSRVHKLWALAQKTNWTDEELNSFKEELKHFEHRLSKQTYYQGQLDLSVQSLEDDMNEGEEYREKHQQLEAKHKDLNKKIKKLHTDFKTRLDKALRHSEL